MVAQITLSMAVGCKGLLCSQLYKGILQLRHNPFSIEISRHATVFPPVNLYHCELLK